MQQRLETFLALELPYKDSLRLRRSVYQGGDGPRVAITAGMHGDDPQGLYTCHCLAARLEELGRTRPGALLGQVELYPGLNPLGLDTFQDAVSVYDTDLAHSAPERDADVLAERIVTAAMTQLREASLVIDIHASDIHLREIPQVCVDERFAATLLPLAQLMNLDVIWLQGSRSAWEATLARSLNEQAVACLGVEIGAGMRLIPDFTDRVVRGVLGLWRALGVLAGDLERRGTEFRPLILSDHDIHHLHARRSGLFVPEVVHWSKVSAGELLGRIVSPFEGRTLAEVRAPAAGMLFTLREYPLVYEGSLIARIGELPSTKEGS